MGGSRSTLQANVAPATLDVNSNVATLVALNLAGWLVSVV